MAEKIRLKRTVNEIESTAKVVSKTFTTFTQPVDEEIGDTVQELFRLYDKLYLSIPLEGAQSHRYIVEESSKLISFTEDNSEIQPLLDEISELRERLLLANQELLEAQTQNNG